MMPIIILVSNSRYSTYFIITKNKAGSLLGPKDQHSRGIEGATSSRPA